MKKSIENASIANKEMDCEEIQESIPKLHGLPPRFQLSSEEVLAWGLCTIPWKAGTRSSAA